MVLVKVIETEPRGSSSSYFHCEGTDEAGVSMGVIRIEAKEEIHALAIAQMEFRAALDYGDADNPVTVPTSLRIEDGTDRIVTRDGEYGVVVEFHGAPAPSYTLDCLSFSGVSSNGLLRLRNTCDECRTAGVRWSGVGTYDYRVEANSTIQIFTPHGASRGWIVYDSKCPDG